MNQLKTCAKCKITKEIDNFSFIKTTGRYVARCKPCRNEDVKSDPRSKYRRRERNVKSYGITLEHFAMLEELQGGLCRICKKPETALNTVGLVRQLSIDHDHDCCPTLPACGKCVRGLVCINCNFLLGHVMNDIELLQSMIEYIIEWKKSP